MSNSIFVRLAVGRVLAEIRRQVLIRRAQRALLRRLLDGDRATLDDVAELVGSPPGLGGRWLGVVPQSLARSGLIEAAGRVRSVRPNRRGSSVVIWTLGDRVAAEAWLAEHVDLPAVTTGSHLLRSQNEAGSPGTAARDSQTLD